KGVVMRFIEVIPAQFLREKSLDSREITNLRQLPVVAKNIRIPKLRAANPEFFFEESLAGDELTAERFARRNIAIRFDPSPAHRDPLPFLHLLLNPLI